MQIRIFFCNCGQSNTTCKRKKNAHLFLLPRPNLGLHLLRNDCDLIFIPYNAQENTKNTHEQNMENTAFSYPALTVIFLRNILVILNRITINMIEKKSSIDLG